MLLSGKNRRGMSIFASTEQHDVESRESMPERRMTTHYTGVTLRLIVGTIVTIDRKNVFLRHMNLIQQQTAHSAIITFRIFGRHTTFIYPIDAHTQPGSGILELIRPQIEHERRRTASAECYVENLLRLCLHQTYDVFDKSSCRFNSCTIDISFHNSQY